MPVHYIRSAGSTILAPGGSGAASASDGIGTRDMVTASLSGTVTHGRQINGANTGIAGVGLTAADLATVSGDVTYSTNGAVVELKRFTGTVTLAGSNITIRKCLFAPTAGSGNKAIVNTGTNNLVQDVTISPASGSVYMCIHHSGGSGLTVQRVDASGGENIITCEADGLTVDSSWLHGTSLASNSAGHADVIEVYGGNGIVVTRSKLAQTAGLGDSPLNIAPWWSGTNVIGVDLTDCYVSGGNSHVLVDNQTTGLVQNIRVLRCDMDGHTDNGRYSPFQDNDGRGTVQTAAAQTSNPNAVLWPSSGVDVSHWVDCSDLTPDNTGQLIVA